MSDQDYMRLFLQEVYRKLDKDAEVTYTLLNKSFTIKNEALQEYRKKYPTFHFEVIEDFFNYFEVNITKDERGILTFVYFAIKEFKKKRTIIDKIFKFKINKFKIRVI